MNKYKQLFELNYDKMNIWGESLKIVLGYLSLLDSNLEKGYVFVGDNAIAKHIAKLMGKESFSTRQVQRLLSQLENRGIIQRETEQMRVNSRKRKIRLVNVVLSDINEFNHFSLVETVMNRYNETFPNHKLNSVADRKSLFLIINRYGVKRVLTALYKCGADTDSIKNPLGFITNTLIKMTTWIKSVKLEALPNKSVRKNTSTKSNISSDYWYGPDALKQLFHDGIVTTELMNKWDNLNLPSPKLQQAIHQVVVESGYDISRLNLTTMPAPVRTQTIVKPTVNKDDYYDWMSEI